MKIKTTAIVGMGAVGTILAMQLSKIKKHNLVVVADEKRIDRYKKDGFYINDNHYHFNYTTFNQAPKVDYILTCTKYHDLSYIVKAIEPMINQETILMSLTNGIRAEEELANAYNPNNIIHSFIINISSVKKANSTKGLTGHIKFGVLRENPNKGIVDNLKELFDKAGIVYTVPNDIKREIWWKLMCNVGVNQIGTLTNSNYEICRKYPEPKKLMLMAMKEVVDIARKKGIMLEYHEMQDWLDFTDRFDPKSMTSMHQDSLAKRRTEVDLFAGEIVKQGQLLGIPTPVNEFIYHMIKLMEKRY